MLMRRDFVEGRDRIRREVAAGIYRVYDCISRSYKGTLSPNSIERFGKITQAEVSARETEAPPRRRKAR